MKKEGEGRRRRRGRCGNADAHLFKMVAPCGGPRESYGVNFFGWRRYGSSRHTKRCVVER